MDSATPAQPSAGAASPIDAAREASSIGPLRAGERPRAIAALARAFYADPVMSWIWSDDAARPARLERAFGFFAERIWWPHDLAFATGGTVGAAIWLPPGEWHLSAWRQLLMFPGMVRTGGLRCLPRLMRALKLIESNHPRERHYYLPIVGVEPAWQGRGLGTALLAPMLERCDREGMPAYLEASSPRSRVCYERSGFQATGELVLPGGPPIWPMWRRPR